MVDLHVDFVLLLESNYERIQQEFLELLNKRSDKIRLRKESAESGIEVGIRMEGYEPPAYMPFKLFVWPDKTGKFSALHLFSEVMNDAHLSEVEVFYDIFFEACKKLKPIFGSARSDAGTTSEILENPCSNAAEYYHNPYMFCVEPPIFKDPFDFDIECYVDFLRDAGLVAKLDEAERVLNKSELVELIKQNSEKVVMNGNGGVGVLKPRSPYASYPRYFIRQELRRRGVQLVEGIAERYAREFRIN